MQKKSTEEIYAEPVNNIVQLTTGINRIAAADPQANSYTLRNELILNKKRAEIEAKNERPMPQTAKMLQAQAKRRTHAEQAQRDAAAKPKREILYRKGFTVKHASLASLENEAQKDIDHSAKLWRNVQVAYPQTVRPEPTDAHHIVAREAWAAQDARDYIYGVGIGINDADNCAILPRYLSSCIVSMANACKHQGIHTTKYYANVYAELLNAVEYTQAEIRVVLRSINQQLRAGTFPF